AGGLHGDNGRRRWIPQPGPDRAGPPDVGRMTAPDLSPILIEESDALRGLRRMRTRWAIVASWCLVFSATAGARPSDATSPGAPAEAEFFERRVRPVLVGNCIPCHGPNKQKSGLRVDSRPALMQGNGSGPVVVPGDPDASLLIEAVRRDGPI